MNRRSFLGGILAMLLSPTITHGRDSKHWLYKRFFPDSSSKTRDALAKMGLSPKEVELAASLQQFDKEYREWYVLVLRGALKRAGMSS